MVKYGAILMDPPWAFRTFTKEATIPHRTEDQPYEAMAIHLIAGLPVPERAAKNCAVFLWESDSLASSTTELASMWGFKVATRNVFIWDKGRIGMGYWSRKEAETVSLLTRGSPKRLRADVRQIIRAPRREHSRKPDEIYGRIEALVGGPYLEMFARQRRPGWDAWGNEVDKFTPVKDWDL